MTMSTDLYKSEAGARLLEAEYQRLLGEWPAGATRSLIATSLGDTFVIACGSEASPPLLLLHGGGVNSSMWVDDVDQLAQHFRVFAVDVPGEPGFSASSRPPFTTGAYAKWLDDTVRGLSLARPSIMGASLGGWLAIDYASRHADRLNCLVLLGPMGIAPVRPSFLLTTLPLLLFGDWGRHQALLKIIGPVSNAAAFPDRNLLSLVQKHFRARMTPIPVLTDQALKALSMPVLAIVGDKDVIANSRETRRRLELNAADARVLSLPRAGHRLFGHAGDVIAFLKSHQ